MCIENKLGPTPGDGEGQGGLWCCSPWQRVANSENDLEMEQQQQFKMNHSELFREHWVKEFVSFAKDSQPFNILLNISYGM